MLNNASHSQENTIYREDSTYHPLFSASKEDSTSLSLVSSSREDSTIKPLVSASIVNSAFYPLVSASRENFANDPLSFAPMEYSIQKCQSRVSLIILQFAHQEEEFTNHPLFSSTMKESANHQEFIHLHLDEPRRINYKKWPELK